MKKSRYKAMRCSVLGNPTKQHTPAGIKKLAELAAQIAAYD